jgi:hypothetical protein
MKLGEFLATTHHALLAEVRVNIEAHLSLTHHFGQSLARRSAGGDPARVPRLFAAAALDWLSWSAAAASGAVRSSRYTGRR